MSEQYSGPLRGEQDLDAIVPILASAFGSDDEGIRSWVAKAGPENFRTLESEGDIVGCLGQADIGQYFGGREVSMWGVYGVAIAPERRGRGHALTLMDDHIRECARADVALSTLFPATHSLYRRSDYERAGEVYDIGIEPKHIDVRERPLAVRAVDEDDMPALMEMHRQTGRHENGELARNSYIWPRITEPRGKRATGYVATRDGVIEGYVFYTTASDEMFYLKLTVHDIRAVSEDAARTLLRFLADHRSTCRGMTMGVAPNDPLLLVPSEYTFKMRVFEYWMTRIVNIRRALEERGYPSGLSTRFIIRITEDRLVPDNIGAWLVEVQDGRATVSPASGRESDPVVTMNIRDLVPVYTGFMGAAALARIGRISGNEAGLERVTAAFATGHPWMSSQF